jgi:spore germination protein GerM
MRRITLMLLVLLIGAVNGLAQQTTPKTMTVKLYFSNEKLDANVCEKVFAVNRVIPKTAAVAKATLEQLLMGPTEKEKTEGSTSFFSEDTKGDLIGVKVKNKTAYVNFKDLTRKISGGSSSCGSMQLLAQMETTLKQFPTIKKVFFAIEGKPEDFYGWMQMECPEELKNCDKTNFQ